MRKPNRRQRQLLTSQGVEFETADELSSGGELKRRPVLTGQSVCGVMSRVTSRDELKRYLVLTGQLMLRVLSARRHISLLSIKNLLIKIDNTIHGRKYHEK